MNTPVDSGTGAEASEQISQTMETIVHNEAKTKEPEAPSVTKLFEKTWEKLDSSTRYILDRAQGYGSSEWRRGFFEFFRKKFVVRGVVQVPEVEKFVEECEKKKDQVARDKGHNSTECKQAEAEYKFVEKLFGIANKTERKESFGERGLMGLMTPEMREKFSGPIGDIMRSVWAKIKKVFKNLYQTVFGKRTSSSPPTHPDQQQTATAKPATTQQAQAPPPTTVAPSSVPAVTAPVSNPVSGQSQTPSSLSLTPQNAVDTANPVAISPSVSSPTAGDISVKPAEPLHLQAGPPIQLNKFPPTKYNGSVGNDNSQGMAA